MDNNDIEKGWCTEPHPMTEEQQHFYFPLAIIIFAIIIGLLAGLVFIKDDSQRASYGINIYASLVSSFATVCFVEIFNRRRARRQYKQQLIDELGNINNSSAKSAAHYLGKRGWLKDGSLKGLAFDNANWQETLLHFANLVGASLSYVQAYKANLYCADLKGVSLWRSDLTDVVL